MRIIQQGTFIKVHWFEHTHKTKHSLEIWAVKLRFLLIYKNMLKSISTAHSGCTEKHENKANQTQTALFLI